MVIVATRLMEKAAKKPTKSVTMGVILGQRFPAGGLFLMPQLKVYIPKYEPRSKKKYRE